MENENILYSKAFRLSIFTIGYNIIEGVVSAFFGYQDDTLALFGFGLDSFIEVLSGIGVLMMIIRMRKNPLAPRYSFEITALRITGIAFYLLAAGLFAGIVLNIINDRKPETTFPGIIISVLSILVMLWLMSAKMKVGKKLDSEPIICDSHCTRMCVYMSVVLLAASLVYELTGFKYADSIGTAGLIWLSVMEGKEALEKAGAKFAL